MTGDILKEKWNTVCNHVATYDDVDKSQFNALIDRLQIQAMSDGFILLTTENSFLKTWVEKNFSDAINRALLDLYGIPFTVVIEIDETSGNTPPIKTIPSTPQATDSVSIKTESFIGINPDNQEKSNITAENSVSNNITESNPVQVSQPADKHSRIIETDHVLNSLTFENFVIGESNRLAYSMAVQVAEVPGKTALNPLFIYGKSGLGKTHLMRAIQNYINETQPDLRTIYVDSEELISGYTDAVAEHDKEKSSYKNFKTHYEQADVLLIDDIQFLQGKLQTLDIVFQIFNKLINQGKQIVLSADRAPKNIDIDERYASRFIQGGTIDIQPPEIETKLAIVKSYIKEYRLSEGNENLYIPEDVQMYIAENSSSNIRELKGAITIIIYHINFSENHKITVTEVENLLENHFSGSLSKNLSIDDIQKQVEDYYRVKHSDLIGTSRAREIVFPRQIAIYLCRQLLDLPFNDIAKKFNKDHSTAMHSVTKIEKALLTNRDIQEEIETLKKMIKDL